MVLYIFKRLSLQEVTIASIPGVNITTKPSVETHHVKDIVKYVPSAIKCLVTPCKALYVFMVS